MNKNSTAYTRIVRIRQYQDPPVNPSDYGTYIIYVIKFVPPRSEENHDLTFGTIIGLFIPKVDFSNSLIVQFRKDVDRRKEKTRRFIVIRKSVVKKVQASSIKTGVDFT